MNISIAVFIPNFQLLFKNLELLSKNEHGTTYNRSIPRFLNNIFTIRMQSPHSHEFELGGKGFSVGLKFKQKMVAV